MEKPDKITKEERRIRACLKRWDRALPVSPDTEEKKP